MGTFHVIILLVTATVICIGCGVSGLTKIRQLHSSLSFPFSVAGAPAAYRKTLAENPDPNVIYPMVNTPLGQLRGQAQLSRSGRWYYAFNGVPYAQPPNRFQPSVPVEPWEGILDARQDYTMCPQIDATGSFYGDENCLILNVFFPHYDRCQNETESGKLPVFFNIHGGGFREGAAFTSGASFLMDRCIVYVSTNYRLGALGFLSTGEDDVIPGNLGLKDQILALNWTRQFIESFRGDPEAVTIMGISAGASSVSHLIASPMATGLFTGAIASSGSVLSPWSVIENPGGHAVDLGQKLNCPVDTSTNLRDCLLTKNVEEIAAGQAGEFFSAFPFGPVIESISAQSPFQTENPAVVLGSGNFNRVPLISGFLQDEMVVDAAGVLSDSTVTDMLNTYWFAVVPNYLQYDRLGMTQEEMDLISQKIRQFYFGDNPIGPEERQNLINLISDRYFVQGIFESVELHSKFAPAYGYVLTYKGGHSLSEQVGYEIPVVSHADDTQFTFDTQGLFPPYPLVSEQAKFSEKLITHWINFMKNGNPGNAFGEWTEIVGSSNALWHRLDVEEGNFEEYLNDRRTFWKTLGLYEYEHSSSKT